VRQQTRLRLARAARVSPEIYLRQAEIPWAWREVEEVRTQLLAEYRKENPDRPKIQRLEKRFTALNRKIYSGDYPQARTERLRLKVDLEKLELFRGIRKKSFELSLCPDG
jgi:hypothetical protein